MTDLGAYFSFIPGRIKSLAGAGGDGEIKVVLAITRASTIATSRVAVGSEEAQTSRGICCKSTRSRRSRARLNCCHRRRGAQVFEQAFKNIDNILRKDAGASSELDYSEQTSWLLFLKYLDALEQDRSAEATLEGRTYKFILDKPYRWETWAAPKVKGGSIDHNRAMTGDDLRDFVNSKLFPYLHGYKTRATSSDTIEYKIGEVFGEVKNKFQSGYNLREVIDELDCLRFRSQSEKHELSVLYEAKLQRMGNAGRNGGEYYTPRPLIRAIVHVLKPALCVNVS